MVIIKTTPHGVSHFGCNIDGDGFIIAPLCTPNSRPRVLVIPNGYVTCKRCLEILKKFKENS